MDRNFGSVSFSDIRTDQDPISETSPGGPEIAYSEPYDKCVVTFECRNPLLCNMKRQRRNDILVEQVIERLKSIRRTRGLTQENVRFDTDLNIGRIESGRHSISLTTLADLCDYYGISLEEFFSGEEFAGLEQEIH